MCGINLKYRDELVRRGLLNLVLRAAKAALKQEDHPKDLPLNHGTQAEGEFLCPFLNEHVRKALVWLVSNLTISPMDCCTVDEVVGVLTTEIAAVALRVEVVLRWSVHRTGVQLSHNLPQPGERLSPHSRDVFGRNTHTRETLPEAIPQGTGHQDLQCSDVFVAEF